MNYELTKVVIDNNKFTGSLSDIKLPAVQVFTASNNMFSGPMFDLASMSQLSRL